MQTLALLIEYDGTNYCGWQKQKNAQTVQQNTEDALSAIIGYETAVVGAGRTDTGVHARGQAAHAVLHKQCNIPGPNIIRAINSKLPPDIRILDAAILAGKFHARFDAVAREYSYTISKEWSVFNRLYSYCPEYLFVEGRLMEAESVFRGHLDFSTF